MKRRTFPLLAPHLPLLVLTLSGTLTLSVLSSGCKTKKDREAEAAQSQQKAQQEDQIRQKQEQQRHDQEKQELEKEKQRLEQERQQKLADEKRGNEAAASLEHAKQELRTRIALYQTLTGAYEGAYVANENVIVNIRVHITTANVPAPAEIDRMRRESEVLQRIDMLGLDLQTEEKSSHLFTVFCGGFNLKPDFSQGMIRFDCSGQTAVSGRSDKRVVSTPRMYVFSFDSGDFKAMANQTPESAQAISTEIGNDLVLGRLAALGGFRLSIFMNPESGSLFLGALSRKSER